MGWDCQIIKRKKLRLITTIKELKELIKDLPDEAAFCYHAHDKGCCLNNYRKEDSWSFPKEAKGLEIRAFIINPGEDYDGRKPKTDNQR